MNGVEVAPLVEDELDRRFPQRVMLRSSDPRVLAEAWAMIEDLWRVTVARAQALPESVLFERVDYEWSFVETLRHLILATDCWLLRMIKQSPHPYHPWGIAGSWLTDPASLGIDPDASPSIVEVLEVRLGRMDMVKETVAALTAEELERVCVPPDTPGHPTNAHTVLHCVHVILNEEWQHSGYANRDLDVIQSRSR